LTVGRMLVISKDCDDKRDIPNRRSSFTAYINNIICMATFGLSDNGDTVL